MTDMLRFQDELIGQANTSSKDAIETTVVIPDDESELDEVLEFSVRLDEEGSEIECQGDAQPMDEVLPNIAESDIWREFRQMSEESQRMSEHQSSEVDADAMSTAATLVTQDENVGDEKETSNTSTNPVEDTLGDLDAKSPIQSNSAELEQYTLKDGVIEHPELGTFRRKPNFVGLATSKLIYQMLTRGVTLPSQTDHSIVFGAYLLHPIISV